MKSRKKIRIKLTVTVDDRLNDLETPKWAAEKLKEASEFFRHARMPDEYYKQFGMEPPKD